MEKSKIERIKEIDGRIKGLREHVGMWAKAGGRGGMMVMNAYTEIKELELEREDLINGTNKLEIYRIERELERLTYLRSDAFIFKKMMYNSKIKKFEKQLYTLKEKDRNIKVLNESLGANSDELSVSEIDNDAGGVPYEVGKEIYEKYGEMNNDNIHYDVGEDSLEETITYEEKGRSR